MEANISIKNYDVIRENSLLITSLSLLYCNFADPYYTSHNNKIEQCIGYFGVIFQTTKSTPVCTQDNVYACIFQEIMKERNEKNMALILSYQYL